MVDRNPNAPRRSAASHAAILKAAFELCQEHGFGRLTIEAIAARAGVGKTTIYRWWPSTGAVILDVFLDTVMERTDITDTGDARADMRHQVRALADVLADAEIGPHIAGLVGEAQTNAALANQLDERLVQPARTALHERLTAAQRDGQIRPDIDIDVTADALFAPIWFRLLVTRDHISETYADAVVDAVITERRQPARRPRTRGRH